MGFIASLFTGQPDQFHSTAPVNTFQASGTPIQDPGYIQAIQQAMQGQQGLVGQLQGQVAGTGPSLAQPLLQQATDQNNAMSAGAIGSIRGMNPGLGARMILQQRAQNQQQAAGQAAVLRNQEQLNAQGQLGNVLQGQLGTAAGANTALQGLGVQQNLGVQGINANVAAGNQQADLTSQGINAGVAAQNSQFQGNVIGGLLGGAGAFMGMKKAGGGEIPGTAAVPGDSTQNDKVPGMLSPGEIVIPRSIAQGPDAPEKAAEFVKAIRRKNYAKGGEVPHYGHVLKHLRESNARLERIEQHIGCGYAKGGEVKDSEPANGFVEAIKRALSRSGPSSSSPSVFDAKSAIDTHKQRLQQALEEAK